MSNEDWYFYFSNLAKHSNYQRVVIRDSVELSKQEEKASSDIIYICKYAMLTNKNIEEMASFLVMNTATLKDIVEGNYLGKYQIGLRSQEREKLYKHCRRLNINTNVDLAKIARARYGIHTLSLSYNMLESFS